MTPTLSIEHLKKTGSDVNGQPILKPLGNFKVAVVRLEFSDVHTTVRTDSASSHGHAYEKTASIILLAPYKTAVVLKDVLVILGNRVVIDKIHPRFTAAGGPDHLEIHCSAWV
jgi:hypothetical protein